MTALRIEHETGNDCSATLSDSGNDENETETVNIGIVPESKSSGLQSSLEHRCIYILAKWKDRLTRDVRISLLVIIPSGVSDEE